jgi:predicted ATPase
VEALSQQNPVLMIFEDAHWTDPTSLETFSRVVDMVRSLPVLLIVTFRPEFEPPWIGRPYVTALTINRLAQRDIEAMIDRFVGNKLIPASVRQDIIERTDGIPLFVEEMTKSVLEAGSEEEAQRTAAAVPPTALAVPASLHASLMARLDRLGPAKEIAQIGAAIGREFSHALLSAVVRKPEVDLGSALDRLVRAGLLFRQGVPPHVTYLFKHALVQDAAYGTLLRERRRALHVRIAETFESQFPEITESQPELLARHYTEAGQIEKAAGFWGKAGQRSLERSAPVEAVAQLTRALDQMETLPGTPSLRREQINIQVAQMRALGLVKGFAAPETKAAAERARLLAEQAEALGEAPARLFSILFGSWIVTFTAFNSDVLRELSSRFLTLAEKHGVKSMIVTGHRLMGTFLMFTGDLVESRAHFDQAIAVYDPIEHRPLVVRFGQDARVSTLSYRSWALWLLGFPKAALTAADQALSEARQIGHAVTLMYALSNVVVTQILAGRYEVAIAQTNELCALADEKGSDFFKSAGLAYRGTLLAMTAAAAALDTITGGITAFKSTGTTHGLAFVSSWLAKIYADLGRYDDACRTIGEALAAIETSGERLFEAEVNRMAGEIALMSPKPNAARAAAFFERALSVSRQQQAKSWELRAAMSMARLWRDQGKRDEARELLAPVYGWFTEGFDTLDLKEAKALLDELAS